MSWQAAFYCFVYIRTLGIQFSTGCGVDCRYVRLRLLVPSTPMLLSHNTQGSSGAPPSTQETVVQQSEEKEQPIRPLASLKWPYVPEESAFPDPLKRDDPKPLQLPQYEAIGWSHISSLLAARMITQPRISHLADHPSSHCVQSATERHPTVHRRFAG